MLSGIQSNFYHYCKRHDARPIDIMLYKKDHPDKELVLGALPYDWIKDIPQEEIPEVTQKVDKIFHEFSKRNAYSGRLKIEEDNQKLKEDLSEALRRDDIEIEYLDSGFFKHCQKITVGDYDYSFLTFKKDWKDGCDFVLSAFHGGYTEPTKVHYVYNNYSQGRVAKPFITRPTDYNAENDNGYMLKKYIDKDDKTRAKVELDPVVTNYYKICHFDKKEENCINGIITDVGGMDENVNFIEDKETRNNVIYFAKSIHDYNDMISKDIENLPQDKKMKIINAEFQAENLLYKGVTKDKDFYNKDYRELIKPLSELEQKVFKKKFRKLKKIHEVKTRLQKEGKFDECAKYLGTHRYTSWKNKAIQYELFEQRYD